MRHIIVTLLLGPSLAACVAPRPAIEVPPNFAALLAAAKYAVAARDYSSAMAAYAAANDAARTAEQRYAAAVGQFHFARSTGNRALAAHAAEAALASGRTVDPTLLAVLQMWAGAGAEVVNTGSTPAQGTDIPAVPLAPDGAHDSGTDLGIVVPESIQPNPDGSVPMRALEAQRAALAPGVALFRVPADMTQGQSAEVLYRVSASRIGTFRILPGNAAAGAVTDSHVYSIRIGRCMSAELHGNGFRITPAQPALQKTGADRSAEWRWTIVPERAGPNTLSLASRILAYVAGRCDEQLELLPSQERTVNVKVAPSPAPSPPSTTSPASKPASGGIERWLAIAGAAIAGITLVFANLNKLIEELAKLRERLSGARPRPDG